MLEVRPVLPGKVLAGLVSGLPVGRFAAFGSTVNSASRRGGQPGPHCRTNASANCSSENSSPSWLRTRTVSGSSRFSRYIARIAPAIFGSCSGQGCGCVDGVTKLEKVDYGAAAEPETFRKMLVATGND
ncbi:hypothetical protein ACWD7F_39910, partial [Streptomyces sp. NPDC005122]